MKPTVLCLAASLLLAPACIIVHVRGDLDEELLGDDDGAVEFAELEQALDGCLVDPEYDLDIAASPWHTEAEWTVRFAGSAEVGHAAFARTREAVLRRIERQGGTLTAEDNQGPHLWTCTFELDGEEGEASVRLVENAREHSGRPHQLKVAWEEDD
jgi:hypothetical protein